MLALLLVAPAAVSCAGDTEKPETDFASESTDAATETTAETERTRQNTPDTLPDTLNFAGAEIHILHVDADKHQEEMYVEEDTGDVLDAAIYTRNLNVEERLNVKIVPIVRRVVPHDLLQRIYHIHIFKLFHWLTPFLNPF